jgi:HNH endonuclease
VSAEIVCARCGEQHHHRTTNKTATIIRWLRERDGDPCHYCLLPMVFTDGQGSPCAPSIDHLVERSRGGCTRPDNIALAHYFCNCARSSPPWNEYKFIHKVWWSLVKRDRWVAHLAEVLVAPPKARRDRRRRAFKAAAGG